MRALYDAYDGPLYQVQRDSDSAVVNVSVIAAGSVVNASIQDFFCSSAHCIITRIYDQSQQKNHLHIAKSATGDLDRAANATAAPVMVAGHKAYGVYIEPGMGYRNDNSTGVATGDQGQLIYAVLSGKHFNNDCCFDYGNAELDNKDDGKGTMEALYFGNSDGPQGHGGVGPGPWIMGDLEKGLWGSNSTNSKEATISHDFVTAILKGFSGNRWALKGGDAQEGDLTVYWDGPRPIDYSPMKKEGAIILGIGGDNSDRGMGTFFEGAMTAGCADDDNTDAAMQSNVVAVRYQNNP